MAEESASPNVSAQRPILRAVTSIITVRLRPERPAAVLGSGDSTRAVRRSPVPWRPWSAPSGAATAATSPPLLREALASAADTGVAAVCPQPESPEAMLGSSNSACTVRRLPVGPAGAATPQPRPSDGDVVRQRGKLEMRVTLGGGPRAVGERPRRRRPRRAPRRR